MELYKKQYTSMFYGILVETRNKSNEWLAAVWKTFWNAFSWIKIAEFLLKFLLSLLQTSPYIQQAIARTRDDTVHWRIYASTGHSELKLYNTTAMALSGIHYNYDLSFIFLEKCVAIGEFLRCFTQIILIMSRQVDWMCHCLITSPRNT